jgi:penicillin-binding protein 1A
VEPHLGERIVIANRADGGVLYWLLKLYAFAFLSLCTATLVAGFSVYGHFAEQAPPAPDVARYAEEVPAVSRIYAGDGTLLGEFAVEWRELAAYDEIPEQLVQAFLAIEDHEFFEHRGIYFRGIARALWANLVAGDFAQGGSTITQQVAKQFLSSEKSLTRKIREAILARRLESKYPKEVILSLYLNHIYLGSGAYGVRAAARRYFSKRLDELDLGEMALLAGLAQAPSRYSPIGHPGRALARRNEVLDRMAARGVIDAAEVERWKARPIELEPYVDVFPSRMPYFAEHVRRYVVDTYGADALLAGGLRVDATVEPVVSGAAAENVDFGTRKQDKRQGWRGPEAFLEGGARDTFLARAEARYGDAPLQEGRRYLGLVESVGRSSARVRVGKNSYELPLAHMKWASPWSRTDAVNDQEIEEPRSALKVGYVIWVTREPAGRGKFRDWHLAEGSNPRWLRGEEPRQRAEPRLMLDQVPHPQSAIFTADHHTGYVLAAVGGHDFRRSEYNRAVQACRQPGSTYKPIYYSAALDEGYGYDTILNDVPRAEIDPVTGEVWTPTNLGGTVDNEVTLEYSMVFSKNVPSVALFKRVGAKEVEAWARRLGFTTKIIADQALALGASCTLLDELTRAFAIFARNGRWVDWVYVRRIVDRSGNLLEDRTVPHDPMLSASDRLDRLHTTAGDPPRQAIPARTAYLTSKLLRQTIRHGFANIVRQTGVNAAGKTGTSSATMDTSFVGYTSRWITSVWMGDDMRVRPLGRDDAAYMTVVPMWARYMYETAAEHPNHEIPWELPPGVNAKDRGDHGKGQHGEPMPLVYRKAARPGTTGGQALPPEG